MEKEMLALRVKTSGSDEYIHITDPTMDREECQQSLSFHVDQVDLLFAWVDEARREILSRRKPRNPVSEMSTADLNDELESLKDSPNVSPQNRAAAVRHLKG